LSAFYEIDYRLSNSSPSHVFPRSVADFNQRQ
jgi:hypothetical protein